MNKEINKKTFLKKDEDSDPYDLNAFIIKNKNRNKALQKLLNNMTKANNSDIETRDMQGRILKNPSPNQTMGKLMFPN
jgi:hypothetical protein